MSGRSKVFSLVLLYASLALTGSLLAQYLGCLQPCPLCLWQRSLLFVTAIVTGLALTLRERKWAHHGVFFCLAATALCSFFHFAVQLGWLSDPCSVTASVSGIDDFRQLLQSRTPCSKSTWTIFGQSVSLWNGSICIVLATLLVVAKQKQRPSQSSTH